jgi:hypothetical protein
MVIDNYQQGNQLQGQRGRKARKFLIGTAEAAHHDNPFLNFAWDLERKGPI